MAMAMDLAQHAIVFVPFPGQGHVIPMLRLARILVDRGDISATIAVPDFFHHRMVGQHSIPGVALVSIPSDVQDDGDQPPGPPSFLHALEHYMPAQLEAMLMAAQHGTGVSRVLCLVIDLLASWAIPVAERCGLPVVGFWPAMLASYRTVAAIPKLVVKGFISESDFHFNKDQKIADLNILPAKLNLRFKDLPWLINNSAVSQKSRLGFWLQIANRAKSLSSILVNSIPSEVGDSDKYDPPQGQEILPIGPILLNDDLTEATAVWQTDQTCIDWLDQHGVGSVIYVSFGSWAAPMEPEKISGFAHGLEASGQPFLWALKDHPSWRAGLPDGFVEKVAGRGKIVSWAPQDDILKHKAVGCYITHCGWNSALESVRHGVRMICYPINSDHFVNCAYMVNMLEIGIRLASSDSSSVKDCIERIIKGNEGRHLQQMVNKMRETITVGEAMSVAKRNLSLFMERMKNTSQMKTSKEGKQHRKTNN